MISKYAGYRFQKSWIVYWRTKKLCATTSNRRSFLVLPQKCGGNLPWSRCSNLLTLKFRSKSSKSINFFLQASTKRSEGWYRRFNCSVARPATGPWLSKVHFRCIKRPGCYRGELKVTGTELREIFLRIDVAASELEATLTKLERYKFLRSSQIIYLVNLNELFESFQKEILRNNGLLMLMPLRVLSLWIYWKFQTLPSSP